MQKLLFDRAEMRGHLLDCFEQQELKPFPGGKKRSVQRCAAKHFVIALYCTCGMPESVDRNMMV